MNEKLELIAEDIIGHSDGTFDIYWSEDFLALSDEEQKQVEDVVNEHIHACEYCGWYWHTNNLEYHFRAEGSVCHYCYTHLDEEEDEEQEDLE